MASRDLHQDRNATEVDGSAAGRGVAGLGFSRRELLVFSAVLIFYAATRFVGLVDFPIYFFCDEAQQANLAHDLVAEGWRDEDGVLFPAYFRNVRVYNLGLSVWVQALPVAIFGKSIAVVRGTSVVVGLFGVAALMLILKWFFRSRLWWCGGLVFAALPAWFLHSRTAFETAMMVSFYAIFLLAYLFYREVSPRWLPVAAVSGGAVFYSYSNGQGVLLISSLLLAVVDWRYHLKTIRAHPKLAAATLAVVVLAAAPYLRFRLILHPEMVAAHFHDLDSYWVESGTTGAKLAQFARTYAHGLSPGYWFVENAEENVRHRMLGYSHLPFWLAPAILVGLGAALGKARKSSAHRLVLVGILAAPFSTSLVSIGITRVLAMVVPATLLAILGLDLLLFWLNRFVPGRVVTTAVAIGLAAATLDMTGDALANGGLWFRDYGMSGMQWGAQEVYDEVGPRLAEAPDENFVVSHLWANNSDAFLDFFVGPENRPRVRSGVLEDVMRQRLAANPSTTFVLTPDEYARATFSRKLVVEEPSAVIRCPDFTPCFYFRPFGLHPGGSRALCSRKSRAPCADRRRGDR